MANDYIITSRRLDEKVLRRFLPDSKTDDEICLHLCLGYTLLLFVLSAVAVYLGVNIGTEVKLNNDPALRSAIFFFATLCFTMWLMTTIVDLGGFGGSLRHLVDHKAMYAAAVPVLIFGAVAMNFSNRGLSLSYYSIAPITIYIVVLLNEIRLLVVYKQRWRLRQNQAIEHTGGEAEAASEPTS